MEVLCVSISSASVSLGIGRTKTYDLINRGVLKTTTIGKRRLVLTSSIRALIEE